MKFLVAFVAFVAVAVASTDVKPVTSDTAELEAIIAAIQSPSTDPATALLLEEMLAELTGAANDISVGPAIIDFPVPVEGIDAVEVAPVDPVVVSPSPVVPVSPNPVLPVQPSPVVVGPIPEGSPSPLVQIIVNINQASDSVAAPIAPVTVPEISQVDPVIVVDRPESTVDPVVVAQPEPIVVDPIQVVEAAPVVVEPVIVADPIIPSPAVILPDDLN